MNGYGTESIVFLGDVNADDFPEFAISFRDTVSPACSVLCAGKVVLYSGAPVGVEPFGSGCGGSLGQPPRIGSTWSPTIGETLEVNLSRTAPGALAALALGLSNTSWQGIPLPLGLGGVGLGGCELLVSIHSLTLAVTQPLGSGDGWASVPIPIPSDGGLVGALAFVQWWVGDPTPGLPGGAVSRALGLTVQAAAGS
jgi:hypothetical protein